MHPRARVPLASPVQRETSPATPAPSSWSREGFHGPPAQEPSENRSFRRDRFESLGLQVRERHGSITPAEQERSGVLQARMKDFWTLRQDAAARFGHHFAEASGNGFSAEDQGGRAPSSRVIQRRVEPFQGSNKIYYYSSYEQALHPYTYELYETSEEAEMADEKYKAIWESQQHQQIVEKKKPPKEEIEEEEKEESLLRSPSSYGYASSSSQSVQDDVSIRRGLIKGTYKPGTNEADLHVDPDSGEGLSLTAEDMLAVVQYLNVAMRERQEAHGPRGKISLHPQGAAVTKMVVELLGEALGSFFSKNLARAKKKYRGKITANKKANMLDPRILPEHFSYLDSLRGENKVSIAPEIFSQRPEYKPKSLEEFEQDMMATTKEGTARYEKYKNFLQDEEERAKGEGEATSTGASLNITLFADQLPAIIALLKDQLKKK